MSTEFSPDRLKTARTTLKLSMEDLSILTDRIVSRQSIHSYETERMKPKATVLNKLAKALGVSPHYLEGKGMMIDIPALRYTGSKALTREEIHEIENILAFRAERYIDLEEKNGMLKQFSNPLKSFIISNQKEADDASKFLRKQWGMGTASITSVYRLLERKGIKLIETTLPQGVLGLSTWCEKKYPLIVMNADKSDTTTERTRFTAIHELGHLLLNIATECDKERICNQFAGCFLLPKEVMYDELGSKRDFITLEEVLDFHLEYGVSVAAIIHQAWDLRIITSEHYNHWFDNIISKNRTEKGWGNYPIKETLSREKRMQAISEQADNDKTSNNNTKVIKYNNQ